jgi:tRNA-dihydrouridine synthase
MGIPVAINGDILDPATARAALEASGACALMVGRGACGAPWMPARIAEALASGRDPGPPPVRQGAIALVHLEAMLDQDGPAVGPRDARKHIGWYLASSGPSAEEVRAWRRRLCTSEPAREVRAGLARFYDEAPETAQ